MTLTDNQWGIAHAIAQTLVQENTDVNEVSKVLAYLRTIIDKSDAASRFLTYLNILVKDGKQIGHSGKTLGYYKNIEITCSKYFKNNSDAHTILEILGWVSRLMKYYKDAGIPIGEVVTPTAVVVESTRQAEIAKITESQDFKVGDVIEAKVTKISSGSKVTYEILEVIKLTQKEPKKASVLSEGQIVKIEVTELKDKVNIKKIRLID